MSKDSKEGKTCLITLNVLLIVLSCVLLIGVIIMGSGRSDLPPFMEALSAYKILMIFVAVVLLLVGVIGVCAAFGGCLLLFYTVAITIITIICVALLAFLIWAFVVTKNNPEETNVVLEKVDNVTLEYILKEENANSWVKMQDALICCGYKHVKETQTHEKNCDATDMQPDCRTFIVSALTQYIQITVIAMIIITVVVLALNCASCKAMKSFCSNN